MENIIKKLFILIVPFIVVSGLLYLTFKAEFVEDKEGILEATGANAENIEYKTGEIDIPMDLTLSYEWQYNGYRVVNGEVKNLIDMFAIKEKNSTEYIPGSAAGSFELVITDAYDKYGNSVFKSVENFASDADGQFEYNNNTGEFRCATAGTYKLNAELWDSDGNQEKIFVTILIIPEEIAYR